MLKVKKLNNYEVPPIVLPEAPKNIKGDHLFPKLNLNALLVAPKESGKTTTISAILDECAGKNTHVIMFVQTINNDASWKKIKESLRKRKIKYSAYTSIYTDSGVNLVNLLVDTLTEGADVGDNEYDPEMEAIQKAIPTNLIRFDDPKKDVQKKVQPRKTSKKQAPDYIIIFDDLSTELKDTAIPKLMKIQRHYTTKIIISSQSYKDTDVRIRTGNLDYLLLFKGIPDEILQEIHKEQSITTIPLYTFLKMYHHATSEKFHFLLVDRTGKFRKDFKKEYEYIEEI